MTDHDDFPQKDVSIDLGLDHYARFLSVDPEGIGYIRRVKDMTAWEAGDRSEANMRRVPTWGEPTLSNGHRVSAVIVRHRSAGENRHSLPDPPPKGEWCEGIATFWEPEPSGRPLWTLHSLEPLHLEPSIFCNCGDHGYIRDGKWISA